MLVTAHDICHVTNTQIVNRAKHATTLNHSLAHASQHFHQHFARRVRTRQHVDVVVDHFRKVFLKKTGKLETEEEGEVSEIFLIKDEEVDDLKRLQLQIQTRSGGNHVKNLRKCCVTVRHVAAQTVGRRATAFAKSSETVSFFDMSRTWHSNFQIALTRLLCSTDLDSFELSSFLLHSF
jgi:hypothetical protein